MDAHSKHSSVAQFCCTTSYRNGSQVYEDEDEYGEYLHVRNPGALAAFVAFCSDENRGVFLRGCRENYSHSYPSLYRERDGEEFCGDGEAKNVMQPIGSSWENSRD